MTAILHNDLLSRFACLGDKCEDTCCQNWSMQIDPKTLSLYRDKAPELLASTEETEDGVIMRKSANGTCVKLEGGLCGIQMGHGKTFLGDACYFYPRVTRNLGAQTIMTATLSCPEVARLALGEDWGYSGIDAERLPNQIRNILPEGMSEEHALATHQAFLAACDDESVGAEQIFARMASVSRSFAHIDKGQWHAAAGFYLRSADARLPPPLLNLADPFNLLHALCGLIVAAHMPRSPRLEAVLARMEDALQVKVGREDASIVLSDGSAGAYQKTRQEWKASGEQIFAPYLRRWLKMQMALSLFPFAGLGENLTERIGIIGVRLATLRLAIMCDYVMHRDTPAADIAVRNAQPLSRALDHLGSARFSLDIYAEPQWLEEARMLGLLRL